MRNFRLTTLLLAGLLAAGCGKSRPSAGEPLGGGVVTVPAGGADPTATVTVNTARCTACHGTAGRPTSSANPLAEAAPPRGVTGSPWAAGAHLAHVIDGTFSRALACGNCHQVPGGPGAHPPQSQGKVTFGVLATTGGASPTWHGADAPTPAPTCSSTYCHGSFANGLAATVDWTALPGTVTCGSCHALPPPATHTAVASGAACSGCHPGYTGSRGDAPASFAVNLAVHLNGVVDAVGHPAGWKEPDQHGLAAIDSARGGLDACTSCHVAFGPVGATASSSCDGCHSNPSVYGPYTTSASGYPNHPAWRTECTFCHGGRQSDTGAPPRNTHVISSSVAAQPTTDATIGAHAAHAGTGTGPTQTQHGLAAALDCTACHPARWANATDPGHVDKGTADVAFHPVGSTANPGVYQNVPGAVTCSSTYCHGNFTGGTAATPSWVGSYGPASSLTCGSCHGAPPALDATLHHPQNPACASCHGTGYATAGLSGAAIATHVDGSVTLSRSGCTLCHGDLSLTGQTRSAPGPAAPGYNAGSVDTTGASSGAAVAAHAAHLKGTTLRAQPVACTECHALPLDGDVTHATGSGTGGARATLVFGPLAIGSLNGWSGGPVTPGYAGSTTASGGPTAGSCASTYCHGNFKNGNTGNQPSWTGGSPAATCGSCHGVSTLNGPGGTHPTLTAGQNCGTCHGGAYTNIAVDPTLHMNGQLDGGGHPAGWKEPNQHGTGPAGALSFTAPGSGPTACLACHNQGGTQNYGRADLAKASSSCNECHANPAAVGGTFTTGTYPTHANWQTECVFCHGGRNNASGAPPRDTHVISTDLSTSQATTVATVGAHTSHVTGAHGIAAALTCTACHPTQWTSAFDAGHIDAGTASVAFGNVGATANPGNYLRPGCSANYCHGNFTYGAAASPSWTGSFGGAFTLTCASCHGAPPALGGTDHHPQNGACAGCHGAGYATGGISGGALATHVDGAQQKPAPGCTACHGVLAGPAPAAAVPNTSLTAAPGYSAGAVDTTGSSATSSRGVGAHGKHLNTTLRTGAACIDCHALPANGDTAHATGPHATLVWGAVATAGGSAPVAGQATSSVTCSSTWCHGAKLSGGGLTGAIGWNAGTTITTCDACHGLPPTSTSTLRYHPQNTNCGACHTGYTIGTVQASTHINGKVEVLGADIAVTNLLACTTCHGNVARSNNPGVVGTFDANQRAAPPTDTAGASTGQRVGAHLAHVNPAAAGQAYKPIACTECHPSDTSTLHTTAANAGKPLVDFSLSTAARLGTPPANPSYTGASPNCNATYCHGATFQAATRGTITTAGGWTWSAGPAACDSCHLMPPNTSGHALLAKPSAATVCSGCHDTVRADGTIDVAAGTHINGSVEGGESAGGKNCSLCHGTIFSAMNGAAPKAFKHTLGNLVGSNDAPTDTSAAWTAATLAGSVSAANRSCVNMCHGDHPHTVGSGTTHENNVYVDASTQATRGTASATTRAATDHVPSSATDGLCISCHSRPVDGTAGRITVTSATYNGTGHDYTANTVGATTYTWEFVMHDGSKFARNCTKCHAGGPGEDQPSVNSTDLGAVHYSDNDSLLMGTSVPSGGTATAASFVCYKCHGNGANGTIDRTGIDVRTQITLGQGHLAADSDARHNTFTEAAATFGGTAFAGAGRHVNCLDCHDPHEAGKTNRNYATTATATRNGIPAGSPITGASGVPYTPPARPASGLWPATTAANYGTSPTRATYEYEICFKCHTAFAFGGASAVTTQLGPSGLAETDLGLEFSPAMRSGHPVVASLNSYTGNLAPKALAAAQVSAPFTAVGTQTMTCTDCHSGDAAAPAAQGPHGSAATFMLRGVNKSWPSTPSGNFTLRTSTSGTSLAYNSGAGTAAGLFCLNCHPLRTGSTWANNVHSQGNHSSRTCTSCHVLIPHGGKVSRLIAAKGTGASALPARYDGGSVVLEFQKAATPNGYDTPSCNASCSPGTHGPVAGGETW